MSDGHHESSGLLWCHARMLTFRKSMNNVPVGDAPTQLIIGVTPDPLPLPEAALAVEAQHLLPNLFAKLLLLQLLTLKLKLKRRRLRRGSTIGSCRAVR